MKKRLDNILRLNRERTFHNQRFANDNRHAQQKYYMPVTSCFEEYRRQIDLHAVNRDVLEYGCALGDQSIKLTDIARSVVGIDISDVAIAKANLAATEYQASNVSFKMMNAEEMTFPDSSFDLVFGSGIIHHLNIKKSFREICRVLRPGGKAIFVEPLGHNPIINLYRFMTPSARTPDEHPLRKSDFMEARKYFSDINLKFFGLFAIAAAPVMQTRLGASLIPYLLRLDQKILQMPIVKWHSWFVVASCKK